jgi:hypothetical protein
VSARHSDYPYEQPVGLLLSCLSVGVVSNAYASACGWVRLFLGRLSIAFRSLIIGLLFQRFGTAGVFVFISLAMLVVVVSVGIFGPRTRGLTLEQISD